MSHWKVISNSGDDPRATTSTRCAALATFGSQKLAHLFLQRLLDRFLRQRVEQIAVLSTKASNRGRAGLKLPLGHGVALLRRANGLSLIHI